MLVQGHAQLEKDKTNPGYKFPDDHEVYDSMIERIMKKMSKEDFKKKLVADYGYFDFNTDMNIDKGLAKIEILKVQLEDTDIEDSQTMPPGKEVRMLQIIVEQKLVETDATGKLDVKERGTPSKLGKDPDEKKARDCFVSCLSGYYVWYDIKLTENNVIDCLKYYTGREEILLQ